MFKGVIFDFLRTLYDPVTDDLLPGASELLESLRKHDVKMVLVSMADGSDRLGQMNRLKITDFFEEIFVVPRKTDEVFEQGIKTLNLPKEEVAIVGDHPFKEIAIGKRLGIFTIWLRGGITTMLSDEEVGANHTAYALSEVLPLLLAD